MFCKVCGQESTTNDFCSVCGAPMEAEPSKKNRPKAKGASKVLGIIGLVFAILTLPLSLTCGLLPVYDLIPLLPCIVALVLSIIAVALAKKRGCKNNLAVVALILSIVAFLIPAIACVFTGGIGMIIGLITTITGA